MNVGDLIHQLSKYPHDEEVFLNQIDTGYEHDVFLPISRVMKVYDTNVDSGDYPVILSVLTDQQLDQETGYNDYPNPKGLNEMPEANHE